MADRVWLQDGIIFQKVDKEGMTVKSLQEDLVKLLQLQDELVAKNMPVYLLYDATNANISPDISIRKQAIQSMSQLNYVKTAVFGVNSVYLKHVANFIIMGIGKQGKIKIFNSKEDAEKWLRL